jgi:sporadic carbohydrate cluster protein (TIGR04323 family)
MQISNSKKNTIVGYVTPRPFGPFAMPVPAQNSCLREYVYALNSVYGLPQCENIFPDSYVQLFGTINQLENGGHLAMYSFHMFPKRESDLAPLMSKITLKSLNIHFVLERKILRNNSHLEELLIYERVAKIARENDNKLKQNINVSII